MSITVRKFDSGSLQQSLETQDHGNGQPTITDAEMISQCVVAALGDELLGIILFGSVARGDADEKSDIDLLVVVRRLTGCVLQTIKESVCDPGKRIVIQVTDLQELLGAIMARDPFILGAFPGCKLLKDEGILYALSEAVRL